MGLPVGVGAQTTASGSGLRLLHLCGRLGCLLVGKLIHLQAWSHLGTETQAESLSLAPDIH